MASADLKDELTCSICLNLYTDPVTLHCGHNFCRECIENVLDTQNGSAAYTCPQCRAEFPERPVLQRNTTLRNIAGHVLSQEEQEEIFCTYCVHTPVVASKTCLWCEASVCDLHLMAHNKSLQHVLIPPTKSFRNRKCSRHKTVLMYYCTEDAECLCVSCCLGDKHRGHQVELLNEASNQKKTKLRTIQGHIIKEKDDNEKRIHDLRDHLRQIPEKAAGIVERVTAKFREIRMKVDDLENHVLKEISKQQEQVSLSVSDLIQQLESKKHNLSREISTIEDLCQMMDPLLYLQADRRDFTDVMDGDNYLKETEAADLSEDLIINTQTSGLMNIMSGLQKGYYVQEASGILLDVNTASNDVHISDDLKTVSCSKTKQGRLENPERFEYGRVLSLKGFSDIRLYWDVEVSKEGAWRVGMTYQSIERKGECSLIGNNKNSWSLRNFQNQYSIRHDGKEFKLSVQPSSHKVRIYLDYMAGLLSFYELSNSVKHLYTYNTRFTEPVYPVIHVWDNAWMRVLNYDNLNIW
ncbi:nuclear factor 7, brain-like [Dendropsophus ebraccatus]|uniref:nuclear factor 7, brain-like n=1 Tax=Dendropsophus ebraccatus TaxID=150705 RepID=UPI0038316287